MKTFITAIILCASSLSFAGGGALVSASNNFTVSNSTAGTFIPFNLIDYDDLGFFNPSYPTRLTIPAGVVRARLCGQLIFNANGNGLRQLVIKKNFPVNGGWYVGDPVNNTRAVNGTTTDINACTPWINVVHGDFFELEPFQNSGGSLAVLGSTGTFFSIEGKFVDE